MPRAKQVGFPHRIAPQPRQMLYRDAAAVCSGVTTLSSGPEKGVGGERQAHTRQSRTFRTSPGYYQNNVSQWGSVLTCVVL